MKILTVEERIEFLTKENEHLEAIVGEYRQFILRAIAVGLFNKEQNPSEYNKGLLKAYNVAYFKLQELLEEK